MIEVTEQSFTDMKEMQEFVERIGKNVPKATAMTLTFMGQAAKETTKIKMPGIFDRPTAWTVGSTYLTSATATTQEARVYIKDGSIDSLSHHVTGGQRLPKKFERRLRSAGILGAYQYAVPSSRMKLNMYGNVSSATIKRILDALITGSKSSDKIFYVKESTGGLPPGIFERVGAGSNRDLLPMFLFVGKTTYRKRYDFFGITEKAADAEMPKAMDRALETLLR
ncbi:MAG: hypothetical protein RBS05_18785 [Zoogloea oleivorans]|jgi:hypothetical protein|uniref:hypothetical protein n=1 Tax=Zoogloea oleivorans TaxID=1552750 RepID=UPI002A35C945|nr:hypothetical protein [Zoogloea oleivorans]MDY0037962.1 hypothetical protein [Zoogloea oleivorans]